MLINSRATGVPFPASIPSQAALAAAPVIAQTTATSFTGTYPTRDGIWEIAVEVSGAAGACPMSGLIADSFSSPPPKPSITPIPGPQLVVINYTPNDGKRHVLRIQRAGSDGAFQQVRVPADRTSF